MPQLRKYMVVGIAVLLLSLSLACAASSFLPEQNDSATDEQEHTSANGEMAPNFTLMTPGGDEVELNEFQGRPVVLNFWTSWCGPCRMEMPDFQEVHQTYSEAGLVILGVNVEETSGTVTNYADELGLTFTLLLDSKGSVSESYQIRAFPTTFFLDTSGVIRHVQVGTMAKADIEHALSAHLEFSSSQTTSEDEAPEVGISAETDAAPRLEGCVSTSALNVRIGPGTNHSVVDWITEDECFMFDGRNADSSWLRLSPDKTKNGTRLWVSAKYINLEDDISLLTIIE